MWCDTRLCDCGCTRFCVAPPPHLTHDAALRPPPSALRIPAPLCCSTLTAMAISISLSKTHRLAIRFMDSDSIATSQPQCRLHHRMVRRRTSKPLPQSSCLHGFDQVNSLDVRTICTNETCVARVLKWSGLCKKVRANKVLFTLVLVYFLQKHALQHTHTHTHTF